MQRCCTHHHRADANGPALVAFCGITSAKVSLSGTPRVFCPDSRFGTSEAKRVPFQMSETWRDLVSGLLAAEEARGVSQMYFAHIWE